jgi:hypothetical protein
MSNHEVGWDGMGSLTGFSIITGNSLMGQLVGSDNGERWE